AKLVDHLKLDANKPEVRAVIEQYRPGANDGQQGLHFYKGKIGRFRDAYTSQQQEILAAKLQSYLERMGYEK
ncbi:MAG: hypothetical protein ACKOBL_01005, partial [Chloroflexota bacterium]